MRGKERADSSPREIFAVAHRHEIEQIDLGVLIELSTKGARRDKLSVFEQTISKEKMGCEILTWLPSVNQ